MAAILEPRHLPLAERRGPRPAPRHLVPVASGSWSVGGPAPALVDHRRVATRPSVPTGAVLPPAPVAGMVAAVVVAVVLALAVAAGAFAGLVPGPDAGRTAVPAAVSGGGAVAVVESGDSYWSIARELQPTGDVRPLVHRLQLLNGGVALRPGMQVVLPA